MSNVIEFPVKSNVIEFPVKVEVTEPLSCFDCVNCMSGPLGSYCAHWREEIALETAAEECDAFERH